MPPEMSPCNVIDARRRLSAQVLRRVLMTRLRTYVDKPIEWAADVASNSFGKEVKA